MTSTAKNLDREKKYSFANINLIGKCNADCYFCLGKDIDDVLSKQNQMSTHFSNWENLDKYLNTCKEYGVEKIYLTGENTDPLIYKYLQELIDYVQSKGFNVGIRNNGYLALKQMDAINSCKDEIGYSVNAISAEANQKVMGRPDIPQWEKVIPATNNPRTSIIVSRHNRNEFFDIIKYLSQFDNIRYIQARCIVSETRNEMMEKDQEVFEELHAYVKENYPLVDTFHGASIYEIHGKKVSFWRNWNTNINSLNYFSDGTISESYFIINGYLQNQSKQEPEAI
ncbi:MAG: Radical domain protein [Bacillales bacterium]|nr:Radical domain protein [Bacillales bacterium]